MFRSVYIILALLMVALFVSACGGGGTPVVEGTSIPKAAQVADTPVPTDTPDLPTNTPSPAQIGEAEAAMENAKNGKILLDDEPKYPYEDYWNTDFSLHTVPYEEILSGGVLRDGIPPIDEPTRPLSFQWRI